MDKFRKQEWAAFVVTSSEGERTKIEEEDWPDFLAQRQAIYEWSQEAKRMDQDPRG